MTGITYGKDWDALRVALEKEELYGHVENFNGHITASFYADEERTQLVFTLGFNMPVCDGYVENLDLHDLPSEEVK